MQIFAGIDALPGFKHTQLLKRLQKLDKNIRSVASEYVHFVDSSKLSAEKAAKLEKLLAYGVPFQKKKTGELFLVIPRFGTISPWASKATDIAHHTGLAEIKRIERGAAFYIEGAAIERGAIEEVLHDRMTEMVLPSLEQAAALFKEAPPVPLAEVDVIGGGIAALEQANRTLGLAFSNEEIEYLVSAYEELGRNPTDVELMMFAQVNSEHCRHKIFNADWVIDGHTQPKSLFKMIKNTYETYSENILSAYSDNAAVLKGAIAKRFFADPVDNVFRYETEPVHLVVKVETHNHPTAIAPFPGAATGSGGEIRDEGATGRGAKPKMGMSGYTVSNLEIPNAKQPWEEAYGKPERITSPLDIMVEAPLGAAAFGNEFGRPTLSGYFRSFQQEASDGQMWGYHKPIMIAGGLGNIRGEHIEKQNLPVGAALVVLGGPAMLIGLGGGAASSVQSGASAETLDFASVQRANAEMERRAQEVIDSCWALGEQNPIITIHDVGAGGLSNALPEIVHDSKRGAIIELRDVPSAEPGLSPLEIWCNEAQERYVLGIEQKDLEKFKAICEREGCPFAVVGTTTADEKLTVTDRHFQNKPVDLPMSVLFGSSPKLVRDIRTSSPQNKPVDLTGIKLDDAVKRVLHAPAVGSKKFLITIADRSVGGLVVRDQMVGPWQVPVSDVAVTASGFDSSTGEAMALGERPPLALINAPASARIAIGEAITNIAAARIDKLSDIKLSANWMAAAGQGDEDSRLYETVRAVGEEFCPQLGLTIPVGKDSLSMRTAWQDEEEKSVTSPLSLVATAFAPVTQVEQTLTPQLIAKEESYLILIDLGQGKNRLGGSTHGQVFSQVGDTAPDIEPTLLKNFFQVIQKLNQQNKLLAYHDRSDGGLFTTVAEMIFAGRCGAKLELSSLPGNALEKIFNEELGAIIQVRASDKNSILKTLDEALGKISHVIGVPQKRQVLIILDGKEEIYQNSRAQLEQWWSQTSYHIQKLRDNPVTTEQEFAAIANDNDPGLSPSFNFQPDARRFRAKPKVAILREQGVNGYVEMAAAFDKAGFTAVDVHLNDIKNQLITLEKFKGLAVSGGFSYGDVLGAGEGWAKSILFNPNLRTEFSRFFERVDTFSFGACNGCQMLAALKEIIPGAGHWPRFLKNISEQFEARLATVRVNDSPSVLLKGMSGSYLPIVVAHGEGRAEFESREVLERTLKENLVSLQYTDNRHEITETYPFNPNGSPAGITGLTSEDGRATIVMPHPERVFLSRQLSWHPSDWSGESPWLQLFHNARSWVD